MDYAKHVEALARKMGARVSYNLASSLSARAHTDADDLYIELPHWSTVPSERLSQFWAAMHELGHIYYRHHGPSEISVAFGIIGPEIPSQEAQAWEWGIHNAGIPLDDHGRAMIAASMASYVYDGEKFNEVSNVPMVAEVIRLAGEKPDWKLLDFLYEGDPDDKEQVLAEAAEWNNIFNHYK